MCHARSKCHFRALSIVRSASMVVVLAGFNVTAVANAPGVARDVGDQNVMVLDVEAILNRWEPVARAAGIATPYWREQYGIQLRQLPEYLVGRIAALQPMPDSAKASYRQFTQTFVNAYANLVLNPRAEDKGRLKLGSTTIDQVFIPITPCRIVDTRNSGGPITATSARNFNFYATTGAFTWSSQGGAAGTADSACPDTVTTGPAER